MLSMRIFGTLVKARAVILVNVIVLWGGVTWLGLYWHPGRGFSQALLIGFVSTILLLFADIGHALAHIFSARYAGAPMDEMLISEGMPRTLYWNNEVSPDVHRMRALGGPIFNIAGLLLSAAIFEAASGNPLARELAAWSAAGHGLLLVMSLLPLPIVDGGTLLKWTLVARGKPAMDADEIVRRIDWGIAMAAEIVGLGLLAARMWIAGMLLVGTGIIVAAIAAGRIR